MGRYVGPVCRLCRREGTKLFLKGTRCYTDKCAVDRRGYAPGQHGQGRMRTSEYSLQLREKQKLKRIYGLLERQFRGYFHRAERMKGITGENLLVLLERRLDNVMYRMGFGASRREARQLVLHGHCLVNGKKVNIPSFLVLPGATVSIHESSRGLLPIQKALEAVDGRGIPSWLEVDKTHCTGRVKELPTKEEIALPVNEQLVVELYSR
ncbi:MAG TPA: 30S ribosomal protein S4 [Nitrospiria bacterium]|nr:30S ribosomal protein S4 [Nitrospiria bacterium]